MQNPLSQSLEPSQALPRQIPPFVTCGDIFPRSGGSLSSQGELSPQVTERAHTVSSVTKGLGAMRNFPATSKSSPFGGAGAQRLRGFVPKSICSSGSAIKIGQRSVCRHSFVLKWNRIRLHSAPASCPGGSAGRSTASGTPSPDTYPSRCSAARRRSTARPDSRSPPGTPTWTRCSQSW